MDFLDPAKKRAHTIRLFIGYGLMTILIGLVTLILLFYTYGYNFDPSTGLVTQNGLIFLDSQPQGAQITVNGLKIKNQTDTRLSIIAGHYDIELTLDNYRTWRRSFDLEGGVVERFQYPLLFPSVMAADETKLLTAVPALATQSPDRRWLLIGYDNQFSFLERYDLNSKTQAGAQITLPSGLLSDFGGLRRLKPVEWSSDNHHVLVMHYTDVEKEFVVLDINSPADSFNVNKVFSLSPNQVVLRNKAFDQLYLHLSDGSLRSANVSSQSTTLLLDSVLGFKTYGPDFIIFAQQGAATGEKSKIMLFEPPNKYLLREVNPDTNYLLEAISYNDSWYFAAGAANEGKTYVYKNPQNVLRRRTQQQPVPSAVLKVDNPQEISISQNGRFLSVQDGQKFAVFDAEMIRQYKYEVSEPFDSRQDATWMDGYRLIGYSGGQAVVFDYDGANVEKLVPAIPGFGPFFDGDYQTLYSVRPSAVAPRVSAIYRSSLLVQ